MTTQLAFRDINFDVITRNNQIWLTSKEIANALGYATSRAVTKIFNQNQDEFTAGMTDMIEVPKSGTSANLKARSRIFSLRGAHLIAMFARTPVAKEFRRWVLDILDKEVGNAVTVPALNQPTQEERDAYNINALGRHFRICRDLILTHVEPALKATESPIASRLRGHIDDGFAFVMGLEKSLNNKLTASQSPRIY